MFNQLNKIRLVSTVLMIMFFISSCKKNSADVSSAYSVSVSNNTASAEIFASPYNPEDLSTGNLQILNGTGQTISQHTVNGATFGFRKWVIDGNVRYSYCINDVNAYHIPAINQLTGYFVITDSSFNEIKRVHLLPYGDIAPGPNRPDLDVHDFILLSDNHYYVISYYPKQAKNIPSYLNPSANVTVVAAVIQEIQNDTVVWQWESTDFPEFYANSVEGNDFTNGSVAQDYMHMNSMIIDPTDNNLIVSFRNQNQVIKIEKQSGKILWRLGGKNSDYALTDNELIKRQHNATLTDNNQTLLIFDNGEKAERPVTRIVEFKLNEAQKAVTGFKSFNVPEPFSQYMGSVQKSGNEYFIGGGTANYILDVDYTTGEKKLELKNSLSSYRAYKYSN